MIVFIFHRIIVTITTFRHWYVPGLYFGVNMLVLHFGLSQRFGMILTILFTIKGLVSSNLILDVIKPCQRTTLFHFISTDLYSGKPCRRCQSNPTLVLFAAVG